MKQALLALVILLVCGLLLAQDNANQYKHETLYRSAKTIEASVSVGVSYLDFNKLIQGFATEILISKEKAQTPQQKKMVAAFEELLEIYKDSALIWKSSADSAQYDYLKGEIIVDFELVKVVEKYKLKTYEWEWPNTKKTFLTIPESSLQTLWAKASEQAKIASKVYALVVK